MKTFSSHRDGRAWRLSFEAVAVFAGLLMIFGITTLLFVFRSGEAASVTSSAAQYAYWSIGLGAITGLALTVRQVLTLERWLART
jgi:hypothetical protein